MPLSMGMKLWRVPFTSPKIPIHCPRSKKFQYLKSFMVVDRSKVTVLKQRLAFQCMHNSNLQ